VNDDENLIADWRVLSFDDKKRRQRFVLFIRILRGALIEDLLNSRRKKPDNL
jgi:hypothetical protein